LDDKSYPAKIEHIKILVSKVPDVFSKNL
jgi:hypothetical protein